MAQQKILTKPIWILSFVSLFADMASEMLYPVVPVYLKQIGFTVLWIGVLEGFAEFTAGISKGYFGNLSDKKGMRLPFIKLGYFLSALSKPMMAFFLAKAWIFFARTTDRLGKGVRTAARDALLSSQTNPETKGTVFGFHRSLDTIGAVIGPVVALAFLYFYPGNYHTLFLLAFIPGIAAVLFIFLLKEKKQPSSTIEQKGLFSFLSYWKTADMQYKKLVGGLLFFALINSSDAFLIIKTKEITGSDTTTLTAYIFYNIVFALAAYPLGKMADKIGFKKILIAGFILFACVYAGFGITNSTTIIFGLFVLYGIYAAATEGIAKAWITNLSHEKNTATAVGFYTSFQSVCSLVSGIIAGIIWMRFGSDTMFFVTAATAILIVAYFVFYNKQKRYLQ